jgi:hypothetical protein
MINVANKDKDKDTIITIMMSPADFEDIVIIIW